MIKKFSIFIFILLLCLINCVFADNAPNNVRIEKHPASGNYGIINLDTNKLITPYKYDILERIGEDFVKRKAFKYASWDIATTNNHILLRNCDNVIVKKIDESKPQNLDNSIIYGYSKDYSESLQIMVPNWFKQDFTKKILDKNNEIYALKFLNYPEAKIIVIRDKSKYGFISQERNVLRIIPPQFDKIYLSDMDSAIFRRLGISYSPNQYFIAQKNKKWNFYQMNGEAVYKDYDYITALNSELFETCDFNEDSIVFTYKKAENFLVDRYIVVNKKSKNAEIIAPRFITLARMPEENLVSKKFKSVEERIADNNSRSFIKFKKYPNNGSIVITNSRGKKGLILSDNKKIPEVYNDFCFADANTLIYRLLGITYDDTDRIIAKKNNKWGIIDRDNKVVVDFVYDTVDVMPAKTSLITEEHINTTDKNYEKRMSTSYIDINFENMEFPNKDMVFVSKNNNAGVIDKNGDVIVPFRQTKTARNLYKNISINTKTVENWEKIMAKTGKSENAKQDFVSFKATIHDYAMAPVVTGAWIVIFIMWTMQ